MELGLVGTAFETRHLEIKKSQLSEINIKQEESIILLYV